MDFESESEDCMSNSNSLQLETRKCPSLEVTRIYFFPVCIHPRLFEHRHPDKHQSFLQELAGEITKMINESVAEEEKKLGL